MKDQTPTDGSAEDGSAEDSRLLASSLRARFTGWTVTVVVVPALLVLLSVFAAYYWYRPQLSVSLAKGLAGAQRLAHDTDVHEYRAVVDLGTPCIAWLVEYSGSESVLPPPLVPRPPQLVYGVYLENIGRAELSKIRLAFKSRVGRFQFTASPQLAIQQDETTDPEGGVISTVTVDALAPGMRGVLVATLPVDDANITVTIDPDGRHRVNYDLAVVDPEPVKISHVIFAGAAQLSNARVQTISFNELFAQQKRLLGLDAVHLPIQPLELSARGGPASMHLIRAPFMDCPKVPAENSYTVPFLQRGADDPGGSPAEGSVPK